MAAGMAMRVGSIATTFAIGVLLARSLGPEAFGDYSYLLAWILFGAALVQAGSPQLLVREVAAYRARGEDALAAGIIRAGQGLVLTASLTLVAGFLVLREAGPLASVAPLLLYLGLPLLVLRSLDMVLQAVTRGLGRVLRGQGSELVVRPVVQLALLLLLAAGLLPVPLTEASAMGAYTLAAAAALAYATWSLRTALASDRVAERRYDLVAWAAASGRLGVYTWLTALNTHMGPIVLGLMAVATDVAEYRVAWQISALVPIGLGVMNAIQAPTLTAAFVREDITGLQRLVAHHCMVCLAVAAPICLFLLVWGESFVVLAFGAEYRAAVTPLVVLTLGQLVNAGVGPVGLLMVATRHERALLVTQAVVVTTNVVLLLLLIPIWGGLGAAVASAGSLIALNLTLLFIVRSRLRIWSLPLVRRGAT